MTQSHFKNLSLTFCLPWVRGEAVPTGPAALKGVWLLAEKGAEGGVGTRGRHVQDQNHQSHGLCL